LLQGRPRQDDGPPRVGLSVSKKVGTAVERNRVRRRLREVVRQSGALQLQRGHDYVLVARRTALAASFAGLIEELERALKRLHTAGAQDHAPRRAAGMVKG